MPAICLHLMGWLRLTHCQLCMFQTTQGPTGSGHYLEAIFWRRQFLDVLLGVCEGNYFKISLFIIIFPIELTISWR